MVKTARILMGLAMLLAGASPALAGGYDRYQESDSSWSQGQDQVEADQPDRAPVERDWGDRDRQGDCHCHYFREVREERPPPCRIRGYYDRRDEADACAPPPRAEEVSLPGSFFIDSGGVGPESLDFGGGGGGGGFAEAGASAEASAFASASASVSIGIHGRFGFHGHGGRRPPSPPHGHGGCGCKK